MDLPNKTSETHIFDAIFVCNGHNFAPYTPHFDGIEQFEGKHMHSHDYRRASVFKGIIFYSTLIINTNLFQ